MIIIITNVPFTACLHEAMGCVPKICKLMRRCHQLLSEFLINEHLPRLSRQSCLSVNDKSDEMIPRAVYRTPGIYRTSEEISGKPQLGDRLM